MKRSHSEANEANEAAASSDTGKRATASSTKHLPLSNHYEVSYMHKDTVTAAVQSKRFGYVMTASEDGVVKFWKRTGNSSVGGPAINANTGAALPTASRCLEFVKSYR